MGEKTDQTDKAPLNPELKARNDAIYGTERTKAPLETTGAHEGAQGEGWSWIWLVVMAVSIILAIYFLL